MTNPHDDEHLIVRLQAGDEAAFAWLVDQYHQTMLRVAAQYLRSAPTAVEEVVQEAWLSFLGSLKRFEGRASLKTWLFRILVNRAISRGKRERRTIPMSALGDEDEDQLGVDPARFTNGMWSSPPVAWRTTPEKLMVDAEARMLVEAAIEDLPPRQKMVITLRDVNGWTSEEVRNAMDISQSNQRVLLHRARSRVRAALEEHHRDDR